MDNQKVVTGGRDKGRDGLGILAGIRRKPRTFLCASLATAVCIAGISLFNSPVEASTEPGLVGKRIVIDAGHGGLDGGAESADGRQEKHTTLAVAKNLAVLLRQAGAQVYLTRETDTDLTTGKYRQLESLRARTLYAKSKNPDAFISIHCNGAPSPAWRGAHVIYRKGNEEGKALATIMQENFRTQLLPTIRSIDDTSTLYVLKRLHGPAVLAEIGFITNPEESAALHTPTYRQRVAFAIYTSVAEYFGQVQNQAGEPAPVTP